MPQNEATPIAGTLQSFILKICNFLNSRNIGPIVSVCFDDLIIMICVLGSMSSTGIDFSHEPEQIKLIYVSKRITNFTNILPFSQNVSDKPFAFSVQIHSRGHFPKPLLNGTKISRIIAAIFSSIFLKQGK